MDFIDDLNFSRQNLFSSKETGELESVSQEKLRSLVALQNVQGKRVSDQSNKNAEIFGPGLLALFESRSLGEINYSTVAKLLSLLEKVPSNGTIVQDSHNVTVELLNLDGDAKVKFNYELANYGQNTLTERSHRFWFTYPQSSLQIIAYDNSSYALPLDCLETTPHSCEVKIKFIKPLEPAETLGYSVEFFAKKNFLANDFYDVHTRTITKRTSFTILSPPGTRFLERSVIQEHSDGFTSSNPPLVSLVLEGDREKLHWRHTKPRPGDKFRTSWSLAD